MARQANWPYWAYVFIKWAWHGTKPKNIWVGPAWHDPFDISRLIGNKSSAIEIESLRISTSEWRMICELALCWQEFIKDLNIFATYKFMICSVLWHAYGCIFCSKFMFILCWKNFVLNMLLTLILNFYPSGKCEDKASSVALRIKAIQNPTGRK